MTIRNLFFLGVALFTAVACNAYRPFNSASTDSDYIQEAQRCLHKEEYACAVENYGKLSDSNLKNRKLCEVYLAQGGVTLSTLVSVLNLESNTMLGTLAQTLVPWNATKSEALDNAKTYCQSYYTSASASSHSVLLKVIALYSHCGIRMAKADQFVATSNTDTACATAGNNDGNVTKADISDNSSGSISSRGMCATDVSTCGEDIRLIQNGDLGNAGYTSYENSYDQVDSSLKNSGSSTDQLRGGLYTSANN